MSQQRLPPPPALYCLDRGYSSSQKGGTLIAEEVIDLAMHLERLASVDGYRPSECLNCGHKVLHGHDYRERKLVAEPGSECPVIRVIRYICLACEATWRVLPGFVARSLWRSWRVVAANTVDERPPRLWPLVPKTTRLRWNARLHMAATRLVQILSACGDVAIETLAKRLGPLATREDLVREYGSIVGGAKALATLAARVHRLAAGVRVM